MENQVAELDLARLREIAEKAAPQTWVTWFDMDPRYSNEAMTHIATFNPATVLALLDELDVRDQLMAMDKEHAKMLREEIDRLKAWNEKLQGIISRRVEQYDIVGAQGDIDRLTAENAVLRSRIEELEKEG